MKKFKSKCGYTVYETTTRECIEITDGIGVCDMCNKTNKTLYLVPVLNHALCPKCFQEWDERAIFYKDDLWFEKIYKDGWESRARRKGIEVVEL